MTHTIPKDGWHRQLTYQSAIELAWQRVKGRAANDAYTKNHRGHRSRVSAKVRRTGDGKWEAQCVAHDDREASLSIGTGDDGCVLLNCHAGCETSDIVQALGLKMSDLFPPKHDSAFAAKRHQRPQRHSENCEGVAEDRGGNRGSTSERERKRERRGVGGEVDVRRGGSRGAVQCAHEGRREAKENISAVALCGGGLVRWGSGEPMASLPTASARRRGARLCVRG